MRLRCYIVRGRLAATPPGDPLPKSAMEHLARCAKCAAEARAYAQLGALLADGRGVKSNPPEWERLRSRLPERREVVRPARSLLAPVAASALAAAVLALAFVMCPRVVKQPIRADRVAQEQPRNGPVVDRKAPEVKPPASEQPRRIARPRGDRIQVLRRYKPWKLTAQAPHSKRTKQQVAAAPGEVQPPQEVAVIDIARGSEQSSTDRYVIDVVAMDDSDCAPL